MDRLFYVTYFMDDSIIQKAAGNKLWLLLSYIAETVKICEIQDFNSDSDKKLDERSNRFYVHTFNDSERLMRFLLDLALSAQM